MTIRGFSTALLAASSLAAVALPAHAQNAMSGGAMAATPMASSMMSAPTMANGVGRTIQITIENLLTGQPFSPSFFETRKTGSAPLFALDAKASDALAAVAEGGNIGPYSVGAAMNKESVVGDAVLAIHALPGQKRMVTIHVDAEHPLVDGVWMLGNTNDGFAGFAGVDAFKLMAPLTIEVRGYDAGSEKNNEKKGFLGALGGGNDRDPEGGVVTYHTGIRGNADAPKEWNWDVTGPVARVTFAPVETATQ